MHRYGPWAQLLYERLQRLQASPERALRGKELRRALEDIKRNYEVARQLSQVSGAFAGGLLVLIDGKTGDCPKSGGRRAGLGRL